MSAYPQLTGWCFRDYTLQKARESYGLNNLTMFPKEERQAGRPTQRVNGIYEVLKGRGAQFGFHAGMSYHHNYFIQHVQFRRKIKVSRLFVM